MLGVMLCKISETIALGFCHPSRQCFHERYDADKKRINYYKIEMCKFLLCFQRRISILNVNIFLSHVGGLPEYLITQAVVVELQHFVRKEKL